MADVGETLKVPGAQIYYEARGQGPLLVMIPGGPADAGVFGAVGAALAGGYRVVAYDPRGNSRSTFDGERVRQDMDVHGDDAAALIEHLGGQAMVFGNSGGAQIGLNLAARHPDRVSTLVAHEPPCVALLKDPQVLEGMAAVQATYRDAGAGPAMQAFMKMTGIQGGGPPAAAPTPEAAATFGRIGGNLDYFLGQGFGPIANYVPDVERLRAGPVRVVVAVGEEAAGQLAYRSGAALAKALGQEPVGFPGDHGGFGSHAEAFAKVLDRVLRG